MSEQARENLDRIMKSMEGVPEGIRDVMADKMATYAEGMAAGIEAANQGVNTMEDIKSEIIRLLDKADPELLEIIYCAAQTTGG